MYVCNDNNFRGVEEISPMQPAAKGASNWDKCSPSLLLDSIPAGIYINTLIFHIYIDIYVSLYYGITIGFITAYWPKTLLVHGLKDTTVPDTSTRELARVLRYKGYSSFYITQHSH